MSRKSTQLPASLLERYTAHEVLGRGGFGKVLRATDARMGREVAIKLLAGQMDDTVAVERFRKEAQVTSQLEHEHVVRVFDFGVDAGDGQAYIVYEYIEGETLGAFLARSRRLRIGTLLEWGAQVAGALAAAHAVGIVHRDVKPENVLLRAGRDPVLIDFGLAWDEQAETRTHGVIMGTPAYIAPEIWYGRRPSAASDQFAWASVLFRALYGERVYPGKTPAEIVEFLKKNQPGGEISTPRGVPTTLTPVLLRALRRDPEERYATMAAFEEALREVMAGGSPESADEDVETRVLRPLEPSRRMELGTQLRSVVAGERRRPWLAAGLGGAALVGLGLLLPWGGVGEPPGPPPPAAVRPPAAPSSAAEALERDLQGLLQLLEEDPGEPHPGSDGPHLRRRRPLLLEARFPLKWARYQRSLLAWAAQAEAASAGETLGLQVRWAPHVVADFRTLYLRVEAGLGLAGFGRRDEARTDALEVVRAWETFRSQVRVLVAELMVLPLTQRGPGLVLVGDLARLGESDDLGPLIHRARDRVGAGEGDAAGSLAVLIRMIAAVGTRSAMTLGEARAALGDALEVAMEGVPSIPDEAAFAHLATSLYEYFRLVGRGGEDSSPAELVTLDRLMSWLSERRAGRTADLQGHLRGSSRRCLEMVDRMATPGPELRARIPALRALAGDGA